MGKPENPQIDLNCKKGQKHGKIEYIYFLKEKSWEIFSRKSLLSHLPRKNLSKRLQPKLLQLLKKFLAFFTHIDTKNIILIVVIESSQISDLIDWGSTVPCTRPRKLTLVRKTIIFYRPCFCAGFVGCRESFMDSHYVVIWTEPTNSDSVLLWW